MSSQLQKEIEEFFQKETERIKNLSGNELEAFFQEKTLPLARIKRIVKTDETVHRSGIMISGDTPWLFRKLCEYFIAEVTMRAHSRAEEAKRKTIQESDVIETLREDEQFDFLIDIFSEK